MEQYSNEAVRPLTLTSDERQQRLRELRDELLPLLRFEATARANGIFAERTDFSSASHSTEGVDTE